MFSDEKGRAPKWVVAGTTVLFNIVWASYDYVAKPIFGDGERTLEEEETDGQRSWVGERWGGGRRERGTVDERSVLLA